MKKVNYLFYALNNGDAIVVSKFLNFAFGAVQQVHWMIELCKLVQFRI